MNDFNNRWEDSRARHDEIMNRGMKNMDTFQKFFWIMWVFAAVLGLGVIGTMIWW
jgi:hypothetical protein